MTAYYKLSGAGNDFLGLVLPMAPPSARKIRSWCRRGVSLGADGLFTLTPTSVGIRMVHFNADGSRADLCLNGCRCAARLAFHLGWGNRAGQITLATDAGLLTARVAGPESIETELPAILGDLDPMRLEAGGERYEGWAIEAGVPHFVLPWPQSLAKAPVHELGRVLRSHPDLEPHGANVDFVRFVAPDRFELRTFERGVEGETLACGTGVLACAAVGVASGQLELPAAAATLSGFEIKVSGGVEDGRLSSVALTGDARLLAHGEIFPDSESEPPPTVWS